MAILQTYVGFQHDLQPGLYFQSDKYRLVVYYLHRLHQNGWIRLRCSL